MNILKSIIEKLLPQALNFNCIMDTGDYPDEWLLEVIKTIYKNKGARSNVENYTPVTLLSCLS